MAIPLLAAVDLNDKDITADTLLTQRKLADYLVIERRAPSKAISMRCIRILYATSRIGGHPTSSPLTHPIMDASRRGRSG